METVHQFKLNGEPYEIRKVATGDGDAYELWGQIAGATEMGRLTGDLTFIFSSEILRLKNKNMVLAWASRAYR